MVQLLGKCCWKIDSAAGSDVLLASQTARWLVTFGLRVGGIVQYRDSCTEISYYKS